MWDEALRRVDGDPARVVLRCTSIGTLAVLAPLERGAAPAGVILLLPVLPETVTGRGAAAFYGRFAGLVARATFRRAVDQDLFDILRRARVPWLAVQAEHDQMTSAAERVAIDAAIAGAGGRAERLDDDHFISTLVLRAPCDAEVRYLTEVVTGVRDAPARWTRFLDLLPGERKDAVLADAALVERLRGISAWSHDGDWRTILAVAGSFDDGLSAVRMRWWLSEHRYGKRGFEELECIADLDDPAGRIPMEVLLEASKLEDLSTRTFSMRPVFGLAEIENMARGARADGDDASASVWCTIAGRKSSVELHPGKLLARLRAHGLAEADARRQLARALLKTYGFPDRWARAADGTIEVQCLAEGEWHPMQPDSNKPARLGDHTWSATFTMRMDAAVQD
jgi:hypothetical protein